MPERCFLGVDLGAESGRVMAGLFDGRTIRLEELHRFPNGPVSLGGTLRWDVLRLWSDIQDGLAQAASRFGENVASVGVDTWGVDYVLFSATGEMLGQPYNYRDARIDGVMDQAFTRVSKRDIFAETGLQFMPINTLYQLLAMQRDHRPLLELADRFLMMPDFFHWCLSGSRVVEFTNATTTQFFHPVKGEWAFDLLRRFELPTEMFGEVVPPGTKLGQLRPEIADRTGLGRVDVVAPATHDTGSAVVAVPTEKTGTTEWAYISSGTWSLIGVEVRQAAMSDRAFELNVTNEGGVDGTYRLLKNVMGLWLVQECRRSFERSPLRRGTTGGRKEGSENDPPRSPLPKGGGRRLDYGQLTELAQEAEPFRSLVDPDDGRFLKPDDMPTALREWCREHGQPVPETEGQFVRCALESLALKYRAVLSWYEELTGTPIEVVHIVGGGTKNELLNQFTADACGKPVVTGPVEATALGNVLVQARTAGEIGSLDEIREVVRNSYELKRYEPRDTAAWEEAYGRFRELIGY